MTTLQNPKLAPEGVIIRIVVIFFCSIALGCAEYNSIDYRNFAIDTFFPTPNEIQIAEAHASSYWSRSAARFGADSDEVV
jgi:hypothetical protein